jgi:hypothetical protein
MARDARNPGEAEVGSGVAYPAMALRVRSCHPVREAP